MSSEQETAVVRRFNRSYTQRIGVLEDSFLGIGMPLGPSRLLYEIGSEPGTTVELRYRLGLDSGYLSRMLRRLERHGWIKVDVDPEDRRRRRVRLTAAGQQTWQLLEKQSEARAQTLLDPLGERQRARLVEALTTADLLVRAATVSMQTVDPESGPAKEAVGRYFDELDRRFPGGFDFVDQGADDAVMLRAPAGAFVVALSDGAPVACGGVRSLDDEAGPATAKIGEIKRMWVDPGWRGAGLGSRLLSHLETLSAGLGHTVVRLDTNDTLTEAVALYRSAGYAEIQRYNDNPYARFWFEKHL
jgi:DNA-binding MarR family transcriptional regulator/GNAT superfamily N-acetyltransferase